MVRSVKNSNQTKFQHILLNGLFLLLALVIFSNNCFLPFSDDQSATDLIENSSEQESDSDTEEKEPDKDEYLQELRNHEFIVSKTPRTFFQKLIKWRHMPTDIVTPPPELT